MQNTDKPVKQQSAYRLTLKQPKNMNYNEAELFYAKTHAITSTTLQKSKDGFKPAGVISVAVYKTMCT